MSRDKHIWFINNYAISCGCIGQTFLLLFVFWGFFCNRRMQFPAAASVVTTLESG